MTHASTPVGQIGAHPATAILVTERFPPDVGGCPELLGNIYTRLVGFSMPVTVLTQPRRAIDARSEPPPAAEHPALKIVDVEMRAAHWGVSSPGAMRRHVRLFSRLMTECRFAPSVIHCGRALPEGLAALYAGRRTQTPYLCWTHGEELKYAATSREADPSDAARPSSGECHRREQSQHG
jgi:phosphatidyl-myo-inositol dimannoside synthase